MIEATAGAPVRPTNTTKNPQKVLATQAMQIELEAAHFGLRPLARTNRTHRAAARPFVSVPPLEKKKETLRVGSSLANLDAGHRPSE